MTGLSLPATAVLSSTFVNDVNRLIGVFNQSEPFMGILLELSEIQTVVNELVPHFIESNDKWNALASRIHIELASATKTLHAKTLRNIFAAGQAVAQGLQTFSVGYPMGPELPLAERTSLFIALLDQFSTSHSTEVGAKLIKDGASLFAQLTSHVETLEAAIERLQVDPIEEGDDTLVLVLYEAHSLTEIADKLLVLQNICSTLEAVLLQNEDMKVLFRVRKIETDCLSIELIAQRIGITALKRLLSAGSQYVYRNYTVEGKLKHGIPLQVDAFSKTVKLSATLKKAGIDTTRIDQEIEINAGVLVSNLGKLLGRKQVVQVDGKTYEPEVELPEPEPLPRLTSSERLRLPPPPKNE